MACAHRRSAQAGKAEGSRGKPRGIQEALSGPSGNCGGAGAIRNRRLIARSQAEHRPRHPVRGARGPRARAGWGRPCSQIFSLRRGSSGPRSNRGLSFSQVGDSYRYRRCSGIFISTLPYAAELSCAGIPGTTGGLAPLAGCASDGVNRGATSSGARCAEKGDVRRERCPIGSGGTADNLHDRAAGLR